MTSTPPGMAMRNALKITTANMPKRSMLNNATILPFHSESLYLPHRQKDVLMEESQRFLSGAEAG